VISGDIGSGLLYLGPEASADPVSEKLTSLAFARGKGMCRQLLICCRALHRDTQLRAGDRVIGRMRLIASFLGILFVEWPLLAGDVALEAGLARVEITPNTSMTMYGYPCRH
jgi:hypothetical protein